MPQEKEKQEKPKEPQGATAAPTAPPASTALDATAQNTALATVFGEGDVTGFENTSSADFAIPFMALLQKLSPKCDPDKGEYDPNAKIGQFYDSSTGELLDALDVIPVYYKRSMVEWKPREEGGGYIAAHEPGVEVKLKRDEKGRFLTDHGTYIIETCYYFCLRVKEDGDTLPCVLPFFSTQLKKSRTWMTQMQMIKGIGSNGKKFTPPIYSHIYHINSVVETKAQNTWRGYHIENKGPITDKALYDKARKALDMFSASAAAVRPPENEKAAAAAGEEETPF